MKLMIVDDSQTMIRILATAAKKTIKDVEILSCYNGQEALECIRKNPDVKLILLDINMPVMNGKEFLKELRSDSSFDDVKVIVQTTEVGKVEIKKIIELGVSGYLMKPYQTTKIIEFMNQLAPVVGYELIEG